MTTFQADFADAQYVDETSSRFAYQRFSPDSGVPLIMAHRLRATIDRWDLARLDVLSSEHDVILFDDRGTRRSSGTAFTRSLLPRGRQLCASWSSGRRFRSGSRGSLSSSLHYGSRFTACSIIRGQHSNLVNV
jgi:pimeloyl-ACP methyl ester carboxylesterase